MEKARAQATVELEKENELLIKQAGPSPWHGEDEGRRCVVGG